MATGCNLGGKRLAETKKRYVPFKKKSESDGRKRMVY